MGGRNYIPLAKHFFKAAVPRANHEDSYCVWELKAGFGVK